MDLNTPVGKAIADAVTDALRDVLLPNAAARINASLTIDDQGRREVFVNVYPNTQAFYGNAKSPPQLSYQLRALSAK